MDQMIRAFISVVVMAGLTACLLLFGVMVVTSLFTIESGIDAVYTFAFLGLMLAAAFMWFWSVVRLFNWVRRGWGGTSGVGTKPVGA